MPDPRNRLTWKATCKVYPAICDIQAPDETIRVFEEFTVTVGGTNERLLYQCPAGKCAIIQYGFAYCTLANPSAMYWIIKVGANVYNLSVEAHPAFGTHYIKPGVLLKANDYFAASWTTCVIGDVLQGTVVGYEISQY